MTVQTSFYQNVSVMICRPHPVENWEVLVQQIRIDPEFTVLVATVAGMAATQNTMGRCWVGGRAASQPTTAAQPTNQGAAATNPQLPPVDCRAAGR